MVSSKLLIFPLFLLVQIINNLSLIHSKSSFSPYIFREYIGAEGKNIKFSDIPIDPTVEFHFILAFSFDYKNPNHPIPSNGEFTAYWDTENLTPSHVLAIKSQHPNVKVAMSLGGDTFGNTDVVFSPETVDSWLSNAIRSITKIVQDYHLDGIDIDYEHFKSTSTDMFAECIGRLLSHLKENRIIMFSSIAPYEDGGPVQEHYTKLWSKYGHVIDYVNFQFYAYDETANVEVFLGYFNTQSSRYYGGKILVSLDTDGSGGGLSPGHGFFEACKILEKQGKFVGIFIWSADDSKKDGFDYEIKSQQFLTKGINASHIN